MLLSQIIAIADWKTISELIVAVAAIATLFIGTLEYIKQGAQKRTELFLHMRDRYIKFHDLCALLERRETPAGVEELRSLPYEKKFEFINFHEELALMAESRLIRYRLTHYMFGFYAIRCWESDDFWNGVYGFNREEPYWGLFSAFVDRMKREKETFLREKFNSKKYRI